MTLALLLNFNLCSKKGRRKTILWSIWGHIEEPWWETGFSVFEGCLILRWDVHAVCYHQKTIFWAVFNSDCAKNKKCGCNFWWKNERKMKMKQKLKHQKKWNMVMKSWTLFMLGKSWLCGAKSWNLWIDLPGLLRQFALLLPNHPWWAAQMQEHWHLDHRSAFAQV